MLTSLASRIALPSLRRGRCLQRLMNPVVRAFWTRMANSRAGHHTSAHSHHYRCINNNKHRANWRKYQFWFFSVLVLFTKRSSLSSSLMQKRASDQRRYWEKKVDSDRERGREKEMTTIGLLRLLHFFWHSACRLEGWMLMPFDDDIRNNDNNDDGGYTHTQNSWRTRLTRLEMLIVCVRVMCEYA